MALSGPRWQPPHPVARREKGEHKHGVRNSPRHTDTLTRSPIRCGQHTHRCVHEQAGVTMGLRSRSALPGTEDTHR